jgi:hypothetical protein
MWKTAININLNSPVSSNEVGVFRKFAEVSGVELGDINKYKIAGKFKIPTASISIGDKFDGAGLKAFEKSTITSIFETQKPYFEIAKTVISLLVDIEDIVARVMPLVSANPLTHKSQKPGSNGGEGKRPKALGFQSGKDIKDALSKLDKLSKQEGVLVLRDYHADNLMILGREENSSNVGLLDFQDALIGSHAYDIVSLLEDARRDIDSKNSQKLFDYFVSKSNYCEQELKIDFEIISLQRNIKILGIFARLHLRDGKNQYINFIPRVKNFVEQRLNKTNLISPQFKNFLKVYL